MERAAFGIYLLVLVISPLLFGAVHAYAYSLVFILILVASLLLTVHNIRLDQHTGIPCFHYPQTGLNFLFYSMLVILVLQVAPLPPILVKILSAKAFAIQEAAAELTGRQQTMLLSSYVYPVRMSLIRWTVYGLFFFGLSQVLNSRKRIDLLCFCILAVAGFISIYGIYQTYAGDNRIWWFGGYGGDVRGTFINRNHFACFMAMALMLATGYAGSLRNRFLPKKNNGFANGTVNARGFLMAEQIYSRMLLVVFCGTVIGLGLVLSASRGAIIAAALGLLLMGLLYIYRRSQRRNGLVVLLLFLFIGGYGLYVGLEHTAARFQGAQLQSSFDSRYRYAENTLEVFADYRFAGVGIGNFQHAYPHYQAPEDKGLLIDYAHNDWAQLMAEAGLSGFIPALAAIGFFVIFLVLQWLDRKDHKAVALGIVPLAVLFTVGIHSLVDFNMHIPANVLTLGAIIAIGQASLFVRARKSGEKFALRFRRVNLGIGGVLLVVMLLLFIGWNMAWTVRHFAAEVWCNTVPNSTLNRIAHPPAEEIARAIRWDGFNAAYWYKLSQAKRKAQDGNKKYLDNMTAALEKAVQLNPYAAEYYLELGLAYSRRWQEPDFTEKWLPRADQAMDLAGLYAGARNPQLHKDVATYWLKRSTTTDPASKPWQRALAKAGNHYRQALDLVKGKRRDDMLEDIRKTLWHYYPDIKILEETISRYMTKISAAQE